MRTRQKRWSYLDDFQRDVNGEYHYKGAYFHYEGPLEYRVLRRRLWLCGILGAALCVAGGCIPEATSGGEAYVILPMVAGLLLAMVSLWTLGEWSHAGMKVRAYVYAKTVKRLPGQFAAAAICCAVGAIGQAVAAVMDFSWWRVAFVLMMLGVCAAEGYGCVLVRRTKYSDPETED